MVTSRLWLFSVTKTCVVGGLVSFSSFVGLFGLVCIVVQFELVVVILFHIGYRNMWRVLELTRVEIHREGVRHWIVCMQ